MAKSIKDKVVEFVSPKKEKVVEKKVTGFDPDLPENKQREYR